MLSTIGTGKNIEQAIENALFELKVAREDVDIKILSEGGLFKKAKVEVSISQDALPKYQKKVEKEKAKEEEPVEVEEKLEKENKKAEKEREKAEKKELKEAEKTEKEEQKEIKKRVENIQLMKEMENSEDDESSDEEVGMDPVEFLKGLFAVAGKDVEINISEEDNYITYSVVGENLGDMIGHRGDCFYAINRILVAVAGKSEKRILLDIGGYRQKRVEVLTALAKRTADRVARTGRYARLDPMNPSERRVIHSALSEDGRVVTLSKGEDPHRYVMIFPKDED